MNRKEQLREITEQNPFAHLGDAVYEILYQGIIHLEIPTDATLSDTALAKALDRYAAACSAWDPDEIVDSDHACFHQIIIDAAHNPYFSEVYRQFSPRVLHYRFFLFRQKKQDLLSPIMARSFRHHASVLHAVQLGLSGPAREQLERDISGSECSLLTLAAPVPVWYTDHKGWRPSNRTAASMPYS